MQKVCIVIPCYNEQDRLPIRDFIESYNNFSWYFYFVNDGSTDKTLEVLNNLKDGREDRIMIFNHNINKGKAEAVRSGVLMASEWSNFDLIGFFDADLSTPLYEIERLMESFKINTQMVVGSRMKRLGANIIRNPFRHYFGRVFSTIVSFMLQIPVYDSQCGAKLFRTEFAKKAFDEKFLTPWLFDVEIFARLIILVGLKNVSNSVKEIPLVEWIEKGKSKLGFSTMIKVPFDLLKIFIYIKRNQVKIVNYQK